MDFVGSKCCHPGCKCANDFLPFKCPACELQFCADHRSRFVHEPCKSAIFEPTHGNSGSFESSAAAAEARQLLSSVVDRHSALSENAATSRSRMGYNVKSSSLPEGMLVSQDFTSKLAALQAVAEKSSNMKTKRISDKTREILMKSKSKGNEDIAVEDRIYLSVNFHRSYPEDLESKSSESAQKAAAGSGATAAVAVHCFFKKSSALGEVLHQISKSYSQICFSTSSPPSDWSLGICTSDTPDWRLWDRAAPIASLLLNCEEVHIFPVPTAEIVDAQKTHEARQSVAHSSATEGTGDIAGLKSAGETSSSASASDSNSNSAKEKEKEYTYRKGEMARYKKSSKGLDTESGRSTSSAAADDFEVVSIVGVHLDDFPNVYYTVKFQSTGNERQTDSAHLSPHTESMLGSSSASASAYGVSAVQGLGTSFHLKVLFAGKTYELGDQIGSDNTIAQLKTVIANVIRVPVSSQKLIYKGTVLKDGSHKLKDTKVTPGSKITVVGTA